MNEPSWLRIDLTRLEANFLALKSLLRLPSPHSGKLPLICGVVKKNAYGLGAAQVAHRLVRAGVHMLATYGTATAEALVRNAVEAPILLFMPLRTIARTDPLYRAADAGQLHLAVHDPKQLHQLNSLGQNLGLRLLVHLFLDTGMTRSGFNGQQFAEALDKLPGYKHVRLRGVYSHLATAGSDPDFAYRQLDYFEQTVAEQRDRLPDDVVLHIANTCAMMRDRRFHLDMVRPGLGLYGYGAQMLAPGPVLAEAPDLQPVVRWTTRLNHVQAYPRGASVGYDCTVTLKRDSVVGVVPVGYGDGYPLGLSNQAMVELPGRDDAHGRPAIAAILGRVNMDQLTIDLTDAAALGHTPGIGDEVTLVSDNPSSACALHHLADQAQSHCYEMLCRLSPGLPRRYVHHAEQRT